MGPEGYLVAGRFSRGCRAFLARVEGEVAGYGWLSTGPEWIGELQLVITPSPGEGYIWNCVTVREHRRRGVFGSVVAGIGQTARREGLKRLWIGSLAIPAERALPPAGFRPALRFGYLQLAGLHSMQVVAAGEPALVADASAVLGVRPARLRLRRVKRIRH